MSVYAKQGDNVVLVLSKAEANGLLALATYAEHEGYVVSTNSQVVEAKNRGYRALELACDPGSRSGAAIS